MPMSTLRRLLVCTSADGIAARPPVMTSPGRTRSCMRFTYAETFCDPTYLAPLAQAAEEAGFDSFSVPDSLIYPAASDARYPYTADGDRSFLEDKPIIEPFA